MVTFDSCNPFIFASLLANSQTKPTPVETSLLPPHQWWHCSNDWGDGHHHNDDDDYNDDGCFPLRQGIISSGDFILFSGVWWSFFLQLLSCLPLSLLSLPHRTLISSYFVSVGIFVRFQEVKNVWDFIFRLKWGEILVESRKWLQRHLGIRYQREVPSSAIWMNSLFDWSYPKV